MKNLAAVISIILASCGYDPSFYEGTTCSTGVCPGKLECCSGVCQKLGPTGTCPAMPGDGGVDGSLDAGDDGSPDGGDVLPDGPPSTPDANLSCTGLTLPAGCDELFDCNGTCHMHCIPNPKINWDDAKIACQQWGGRLTEIESLAEATCIATHTINAWIGLRQSPPKSTPNDGWKWDQSGNPLTYIPSNWGPGMSEPQDNDGIENGEQDCVRLHTGASSPWDDKECTTATYEYLCERY